MKDTAEFSWINFDGDFIRTIVYSPKTAAENRPRYNVDADDIDALIPDMEKIADVPTRAFITTYREEIEAFIFENYPGLVRKLYCKYFHVDKKNEIFFPALASDLRQCVLGENLLAVYQDVLYKIGFNDNVSIYDLSPWKNRLAIDLSQVIYNEVPLYDFQEAAVKKLQSFASAQEKRAGILVMPTGSGKTRTAVYFLLQDMISNGYQVIWLAHRHLLLEQAADAFFNLHPVIKKYNSDRKRFSMLCISGQHSSIRKAEKSDDVLLISVQSGIRNVDYLEPALSDKIIIVIDEAHHTVAKSYRHIIEYICGKRKNVRLLGLTATPIRGNDNESKYLMRIYDDNIIYSISTSRLIAKKVLSEPRFERINTEINFEPIITLDEEKYIKKYGELAPTLINKIAASAERNQCIVDTYIQNRERYGKTLIFALNGLHCFTLCQDLKEKGVNCDFIYANNDNKDNERKIRAFKNGKLDVLVNINIMTEGSDVPDIDTVFLTRPTQSDSLLVQMIGRGMRGELSGGTRYANIVDFCDKWETFNNWLNPQWLIGEAEELEDKKYNQTKPVTVITWKEIAEMYKGISYKGDSSVQAMMALPLGWYECFLGNEKVEDVLVFNEAQHRGYEAIKSYLNEKFTQDESLRETYSCNTKRMLRKFFGGFDMPPTLDEINVFVAACKYGEDLPKYHSFAERDAVEPELLANKLRESNAGVNDVKKQIDDVYKQYPGIIDNLFGGINGYVEAVIKRLYFEVEDIGKVRKVMELPAMLYSFRIKSTYNLEELYQEVVDEQFGGNYDGIGSITWTKKAYSTYYGKFYFNGNHIKINKVLDSPDVPKEVVKYVIYHEMLHRDYPKHNKEFRQLEHKYPNYVEWDRFLDNGVDKLAMHW